MKHDFWDLKGRVYLECATLEELGGSEHGALPIFSLKALPGNSAEQLYESLHGPRTACLDA